MPKVWFHVAVAVALAWTGAAFAQAPLWSGYGPTRTLEFVRAMAFDPTTPSTIYVGTQYDGVIRSTDGGATWHQVLSLGALRDPVMALAADQGGSGTVYAATENTLFKSIDAGETWSGTGFGVDILGLAIDPTTPSTVVAGTNGSGIYRSLDAGATWNQVNTGLPPTPARTVHAIAIDPVVPSRIYAATRAGMYRSLDGGGSWSAINSGLTNTVVQALVMDADTPSTLYAGTGNGIFKSVNGGGNWAPVYQPSAPTDVLSLAIDPATPSNVYGVVLAQPASVRQLVRSADGGANWTGGLISAPSIEPVAVQAGAPSAVFLGGSVPQRSIDFGTSWTALGGYRTVATALAIDPADPNRVYFASGEVYSTTAYEGRGAYVTTNGGSTWASANLSGSVNAIAIDPLTPTILYAGTENSTGLLRSSDGAATWTAANVGLTNKQVRALAIHPTTPTTLYAGTLGGVFASTDSAATWSAINGGLTNDDVFALAIDPVTPTRIVAGTAGGVFERSGGSWVARNNGLTNLRVNALAIEPSVTSTMYAGTDGGVFKTVDGGSTWSTAASGITTPVILALAIDPVTPSTVYAGTFGGGVFVSSDGGATWTAMSNGLTDRVVMALAINPLSTDVLYAATRAGVYDTRRLTGGACVADGDCPDENCVDGVCCAADCTATCSSCANAVTGAADGTCTAVGHGQSTTNGCSAPGVCSGIIGEGSCLGPSPTATATAEATATDTPAPTATATDTPTGEPTPTDTATASATASLTATSTATTAPTTTDTTAPSATATSTATHTPASTTTATASAPPSATPTSTPTTPAFACPAAPSIGCRTPRLSLLKLSATSTRPSLRWQWRSDEVGTSGDFGNPVQATSYALCIYDRTGGSPRLAVGALAGGGTICGSRPCWKATSSGFAYRDPSRSADGLVTIILRSRTTTKLIVAASGPQLAMPTPVGASQMLAQDPDITVQLLTDDGGPCWEAVYPGLASRNTATRFKDRLP